MRFLRRSLNTLENLMQHAWEEKDYITKIKLEDVSCCFSFEILCFVIFTILYRFCSNTHLLAGPSLHHTRVYGCLPTARPLMRCSPRTR